MSLSKKQEKKLRVLHKELKTRIFEGVTPEETECLSNEDFFTDENNLTAELAGKVLAVSFLHKLVIDNEVYETRPKDVRVAISYEEGDERDRVQGVTTDDTYKLGGSVDFKTGSLKIPIVMNTCQEVLILNGYESVVILPEQMDELLKKQSDHNGA